MQVLLRIANGKSNVRKVRIQSDTVIGRSPECQLKVASNQISRRHCQIVIRDTVVAIKDLGSANGTFVNGRQVPPEVEIPLTPGTRVMLGPLQFTVEYDLPGMPAVAVAVSTVAEAVAATPVAQVAAVEPPSPPQVQVETLQVVPPDGATPFPPVVVVPEQQVPPQHISPQSYPPAATPVAVAAAAPAAPVNHVTVPPPAPVPVPVAIPAPVVAVAAPVIAPPTPVVAMASPIVPPAPPPATAPPAPAATQFFLPPVEASTEEDQEDTGGFNFGIFAASGSDVVVESAAEITMISEPDLSAAQPPEPVKPAKKGLLQMFGWGKKKVATPEPEATPEVAAEAEATIAFEQSPIEEAPAGGGLSFEMPVAEDAAVADDDSSDESLQNFFNNFK